MRNRESPLDVERKSRIEVATAGFDPTLCGIGSDPYGSLIAPRLRVPYLATSSQSTRYQFTLCVFPLPRKRPVRLVGLRQMLEIGLDLNAGVAPVYPVTKLVGRSGSGNPNWRPPDANVSWHVRIVRDVPNVPWSNQSVLTSESFSYRWSESPSLLFETATFPAANLDGRGHSDNYLSLTAYTPPNMGRPSGEPVSDLGTFYDVRFPDDDPSKQAIEPIEVRGPGFLVFSASVWQTNAVTRASSGGIVGNILPVIPEDAFLSTFTGSPTPSNTNSTIYWGVGGAMVIER